MRRCAHQVEVAIDLGQTCTNVAYSYTREDEKREIVLLQRWHDQDIDSCELLTALLYKDGNINSLGFTARKRYESLSQADLNSGRYIYVQDFLLAFGAAQPHMPQLPGGMTLVQALMGFLSLLHRCVATNADLH